MQPSPPLPLLGALHNLDALDVRAEHLDPHLHRDPRQLVAQQERRVHTPQPDAQADARERVAALEGHAQDVADLDAARVAAVVEEGLALARGVEHGELRLVDGGDGVFTFRGGGWGRGVDLQRLFDCVERKVGSADVDAIGGE